MKESSYLTALEDAQKAGIQIVFVDGNIEDSGILYVGTNNLEAGRLLGEELIRITGGSTVVMVISGTESAANMNERLQGLYEAVADEPGVKIQRVEYCNYDSVTIMEKYNQLIWEEPMVDTIVCLEGISGQTLSQVLTPETCTVDHILAFELNDDTKAAIQSGVVDGVIVQEQVQMGAAAVEEILHYAQEGRYSAAPLSFAPASAIYYSCSY